MSDKKKELSIHSSAAEYLTFIASSGEGGVEAVYTDENIWLTQKMMGVLYDVDVRTINDHIKNIYNDSELEPEATIRNFRIVQTEGSRKVNRDIKHHSLEMIIAVGYKVNSERAVQFRKWATQIVGQFTIKAYVMDDERLKSGHMFTDKYFEEQLERIREIRLSERKFYQKITDIYATSIDYDVTAKATKRFFATVQNKLHWAIHKHTAAELIMTRADAEKNNMGLITWKDAPHGKIQRFDVSVAKNYLTNEELNLLERYVSMYLDYAEMQAERNIPMTMEDWSKRLDAFLQFNEMEILQNYEKVTAEIAKTFTETEFEKYRVIQDKLFESDFDKFLIDAAEGTVHDRSEDHE